MQAVITPELKERVYRHIFEEKMVVLVDQTGKPIPEAAAEDFLDVVVRKMQPPRLNGVSGILVTDEGFRAIDLMIRQMYNGYQQLGGTQDYHTFLTRKVYPMLPPGTPAFQALVTLQQHLTYVHDQAEKVMEPKQGETVH